MKTLVREISKHMNSWHQEMLKSLCTISPISALFVQFADINTTNREVYLT